MRLKLLFLMTMVASLSFAVTLTEDFGFSFSKEDVLLTQDKDFTISPNPGKDKLNIKLPSSIADTNIEVFDVLGKRVYKGVITQLESSINVSNWKSGVYLVKVSDGKSTQTKRFIKQ
ncbi:T9SS type A sorting domain-containing protein [Winogradskyella flava]|uniref:T9SS type A sorting domain-containing protein n=1 Tax=Winogradskyella flava TaxID=1884876 RepID=A0A842IVW2_9FLAO|nr:T9SS type A sorting domain-containing protein [Winogradskyella flava]MBC2845876.1 T9SS type A sorting domain-containing protein [Winogradskyella flava]